MTAFRLPSRVLPLVLLLAGLSLQGCAMASRASSGGASAGGVAILEVVNRSSTSVYSMNASACSDTAWGSDRLGSDTISPGETMRFELTPGCWDFRADFDADHTSGNELTQRNIQIGGGSSWTWTIGG